MAGQDKNSIVKVEQYGVLILGMFTMVGLFLLFLYLRPDTDKTKIEPITHMLESYTLAESGSVANQDSDNFIIDTDEAWFGSGNNPSMSFTGLIFDTPELQNVKEVKSAKLHIIPDKDQYINVHVGIFTELSESIEPYTLNDQISTRQLSNSFTEINDDAQWKKDTAYEFDVTEQVNEFLQQKNGADFSRVGVIFKNLADKPFARKTFVTNTRESMKSVTLVVEYDTENILESLNVQ